MKVEIFTASDWTRILKEGYEKTGPINWKEVSEEISKMIAPIMEYLGQPIEYNTSKSGLHPNNSVEDENVR